MKDKKITYLLGAGASANTIPVVANFQQRIQEIIAYLNLLLPSASGIPPFIIDKKYAGGLEKIIEEFNWLINEAGNYFTIDTLAKKYYLIGDETNLSRLKRCLITYFTLEQYIIVNSIPNKDYHFNKSETDKRYDSFIAAIGKRNTNNIGPTSINDDQIKVSLNDDIKILSWNYDIQFERCLQRFLNKKIHFIQSKFQIYPNKNSIDITEEIFYDKDKFSMVKLNGNAIWDEFINQPLKNIPTIYDSNTNVKDNKELLEFYLKNYEWAFSNQYQQSPCDPTEYFNFAWEVDRKYSRKYIGYDKNIELAELIASETNILVVIGYSFPIFNREIDNRLFNKMAELKRVYIQDKNPERIKSTMINAFNVLQESNNVWSEELLKYKEMPKIEILCESYTDQFVIPYELN